jgi:hypothetical protein
VQIVADWEHAGGIVFDLETSLQEYAGVEFIEVERGAKIVPPAEVFDVHFGVGAALYLKNEDAFMDGMYVREIVDNGSPASSSYSSATSLLGTG